MYVLISVHSSLGVLGAAYSTINGGPGTRDTNTRDSVSWTGTVQFRFRRPGSQSDYSTRIYVRGATFFLSFFGSGSCERFPHLAVRYHITGTS